MLTNSFSSTRTGGNVSLRPSKENVPAVLAVAQELTGSEEVLLWKAPSEAPKALQASECSELLDPMRVSFGISALH